MTQDQHAPGTADALPELYAPPDAPDHPYYTLANAEWARE